MGAFFCGRSRKLAHRDCGQGLGLGFSECRAGRVGGRGSSWGEGHHFNGLCLGAKGCVWVKWAVKVWEGPDLEGQTRAADLMSVSRRAPHFQYPDQASSCSVCWDRSAACPVPSSAHVSSVAQASSA
eukprot:358601-Chlamydomonas_euryale.AAC.2